ncbi:MBL fold metallo-hydrolase [Vulgatibacter incomptus]|uniref:Beta-lactamase related protein n=1 Tax=Vulgatibacter incomptus TaxID=1391653 RepID=A0A0K1PJ94_9BACT|nr:MBL fold metallo-hydrolase [Vulgatibacter incomptus]AKU93174.1 Beta-lactamase related protein [Vulgatibacter incomptus]
MTSPRLVTVDADYLMPEFAACYLRVQGGEAAFIETNTAYTVPRLMDALRKEGLRPEQVRWVIVTHAHLDHAGGASALLAECPQATLVAHPRAARHLVDPSKLVASARAVYGDAEFDKLYGEIAPISAERVRTPEDGDTLPLGDATLHFLHTRGHANHHFVVHDPARETVFTGDTFGLAYPRLQRAGRFVFASTSPTDFDAEQARLSVDRIIGLGTPTACLTHFGEIDELAVAARQLHRWIDRSEDLMEQAASLEPERRESFLFGELSRAMEEETDAVGLVLDERDRSQLEMDVRLNAQGLAFALSRKAR